MRSSDILDPIKIYTRVILLMPLIILTLSNNAFSKCAFPTEENGERVAKAMISDGLAQHKYIDKTFTSISGKMDYSKLGEMCKMAILIYDESASKQYSKGDAQTAMSFIGGFHYADRMLQNKLSSTKNSSDLKIIKQSYEYCSACKNKLEAGVSKNNFLSTVYATLKPCLDAAFDELLGKK